MAIFMECVSFCASFKSVAATASLLLCLVVMTSRTSAAPFCSGDVPTDPTTQEHIKQVVGGLEILIALGSRLNTTLLDIQDFQSVNVSLQMVCNMYNIYTHFTAMHMFSTVFPPSGPRIDYTANQFVAWRVMNSACHWARATSIAGSLMSDCSFNDIASVCYSFNHRRLIFEDRIKVGCSARERVPISADLWVTANDLPSDVASHISSSM